MLVFPQLQSGAIAQYPAKQEYVRSAIVNNLPDGSVVTYVENTPAVRRWDLSYRDVTDAELKALVDFFNATEGQHRSFTFLDPLANLLADSDVLTSKAWVQSPLIQITSGIGDYWNGLKASRLVNTAQASQALAQTISAPASYAFCFSAYTRSDSAAPVTLSIGDGGQSVSQTVVATSDWRRVVVSAQLKSAAEATTLSIGLAPGISVELCGIQAEPQPQASAYKPGGTRQSVYSAARFEQDTLTTTSDGPGQHRYRVRILARD